MPKIKVSKTFIDTGSMLDVAVGTNCPVGGDTGHGARTILRLTNHGSTDLRVRVDDVETEQVKELEIVLGGDWECEAFIQSLDFAVQELKLQSDYYRETEILEVE